MKRSLSKQKGAGVIFVFCLSQREKVQKKQLFQSLVHSLGLELTPHTQNEGQYVLISKKNNNNLGKY